MLFPWYTRPLGIMHSLKRLLNCILCIAHYIQDAWRRRRRRRIPPLRVRSSVLCNWITVLLFAIIICKYYISTVQVGGERLETTITNAEFFMWTNYGLFFYIGYKVWCEDWIANRASALATFDENMNYLLFICLPYIYRRRRDIRRRRHCVCAKPQQDAITCSVSLDYPSDWPIAFNILLYTLFI